MAFRRYRSPALTLTVSLLAVGFTACAGKDGGPVQPYPGDDDGGYIPDDPVPETLPPFVFEARPHAARTHTVWSAPPSLANLPPLQTSKRCWRPGRRPVDDVGIAGRQPAPKKKTKPKKPQKKPYAIRPYGESKSSERHDGPVPKDALGGADLDDGAAAPVDARPSGNVTSQAEAEAPSTPPRPSSTPAPGAASGADMSAPEADFEEVDTPARSSDKRLSRSERRQKRKNERSNRDSSDAAGAAVTSSEPAAAPYYDDEDYAEPVEIAAPTPEWPPEQEGWGEATFLSNDDSMSLSSAQRLIYAIEHYMPLPREHVRPHELLNYFSFRTAPVASDHDFSVRGEMAAEPNEQGLHGLALAVDSWEVTRESRRNVNLTLVVDRSGSMREEGRMEFLKRGLLDMVRELKAGDVISLVSFDHQVCAPVKNFVVGRDDPKVLTKAIHDLRPRGNTNLHAGLEEAYRIADGAYRDTYSNRVLLITDALANTGVTDAGTMSMVTNYFDSRRIRLSGIGVGREFNDELLDRMTEKGRGAYVFLGSEAEVDAVFGSRFISLIETVANDVHFRLHLPPTMRLQQFHGEEASARREDVQAIHYFANTSQLFLAEVEAWQGEIRPEDTIMLEVDYEHAETGEALIEEFVIPVGEMLESNDNLKKGMLVMDWVNGLRALAYLATPGGWRPEPAGWPDPYGAQLCADGRQALQADAATLSNDPEVRNVLRLWDVACARYGQARRPTRRNENRWPGAAGQ